MINESVIRYAMKYCNTAAACAEFLNVDYSTFKKYAKLYIDSETNKSLFELSKEVNRKNEKRKYKTRRRISEAAFQKIVSGETPNYLHVNTLAAQVRYYCILEEHCNVCKYDQARVDFKKPLLLDFIDGDIRNGNAHNLRWLCYNCYFQVVGDLIIMRKQLKLSDEHLLNFG